MKKHNFTRKSSAGNLLVDLRRIVDKKTTAPSAHTQLIKKLDSQKLDWNAEFQVLYSKVVVRHNSQSQEYSKKDVERTIQLRKLAANFAEVAEQIAVIIIKELNLQDALKTVKPTNMGGYAGTVCKTSSLFVRR